MRKKKANINLNKVLQNDSIKNVAFKDCLFSGYRYKDYLKKCMGHFIDT